jgi:hypothetical protein
MIQDELILSTLHTKQDQITFLLQRILMGQAKIEERIKGIEEALATDPWTQGKDDYYEEYENEMPF